MQEFTLASFRSNMYQLFEFDSALHSISDAIAFKLGFDLGFDFGFQILSGPFVFARVSSNAFIPMEAAEIRYDQSSTLPCKIKGQKHN